MKKSPSFLILLTLILLSACSLNEAKHEMLDEPADIEAFSDQTDYDGGTSQTNTNSQQALKQKKERKIIKTGSITFETSNLEKTNDYLMALSQKLDGFLAEQNTYQQNDRDYYSLKIRVPNENFDRLVSGSTKGAKHIDHKNVNASDVTMEYIDLEARIHSKKELEKRYAELLQKANKISDMLEIEDKMNQLRQEIESMEGQFNYLKDQISYSSLNIKFYVVLDLPKSDEEPGFGPKAAEGFNQGWEGVLSFIIGLTYIWPLLLFLGIGGYIVYWKLKLSKK